MPTPYGLVRFGVAPDHPEVKAVQNDFALVASDPRYRFFGNVHVGQDISLAEVRQSYDAVVLAYGAAADRDLAIPGNDLAGIHSARAFVNWYNGHPMFSEMSFDLSRDSAVVIGQGNVALDVARILCTPLDLLRKTDIAAHALEVLAESKIKKVHVIGRRGPPQAAFTIKELRELTTLPGCSVHIRQAEIDLASNPASDKELEARPRKRKMDLIRDIATASANKASTDKEIHLRFLLSPSGFEPERPGAGHVGAAVFERTRLEGPAEKQAAVGTGQFETIPAGVVFKSIGYKSLALEGLPFDSKRHVIPSRAGRVVDPSTVQDQDQGPQVLPGVYVTGWLRRGASGIIASNIADAKETVASIVEDTKSGAVPVRPASLDIVSGLLQHRAPSGKPLLVVTGANWARIDAEEVRRGASSGRPREKIVTVEELLRVAHGV